jgi:hypothetical protein
MTTPAAGGNFHKAPQWNRQHTLDLYGGIPRAGTLSSKAEEAAAISKDASSKSVEGRGESIEPKADEKACIQASKTSKAEPQGKVYSSHTANVPYAKKAYDAYQKGLKFEEQEQIVKAWKEYNHAFYLQRKAQSAKEGLVFLDDKKVPMNSAYYNNKIWAFRRAYVVLAAHKVPKFSD